MPTIALCLILAQALTSQQIGEAIAEGVKLKDQQHKIGAVMVGQHGGFDLWLTGPVNRIAYAASEAAKRYETLTPERAPTDMGIRIVASPKRPEWYPNGWSLAPLATGMVLRTKAGEIVKPERQELHQTGFANAAGGQFPARGVEAWFASLPDGEVDIIVTTEQSERKYSLKSKDREKVR